MQLTILAFGSIGLLAAVRTGSAQQAQGVFVIWLGLLFMSSMIMPRNLITASWFKTVATYNPMSYLVEAPRSLFITGWDAQSLALGTAIAARRPGSVPGGIDCQLEIEDPEMSARSVSVAQGVAYQCTRKLIRLPAKLLPSLLLPLFMFAAFGGALGAVGNTRGFGYYNYTAFVFVFVVYMAAMFAAVFTTFDIAADYESGFGHRMMLAAPRRLAIVGGYVIVSFWRGLLNVVVVFAIALATGMPVQGDALDIAASDRARGAAQCRHDALRGRHRAAVPEHRLGVLILIPSFMLFFLSPIFIPRPPAHRLAARPPPTSTRSPRCSKPVAAFSPTTPSRWAWALPPPPD